MPGFLDIIELCNNFPQDDSVNSEAYDQMVKSLWLFYLPDDPNPHGYLIDSVVERMPWTSDFRLTTSPRKEVHLLKHKDTEDWQQGCNEAIENLIKLARERKVFPRLGKKTDEQFPIVGAQFDISIERSAISLFGIIGRGAHMTVYVRSDEGLKFWIPRRSATKSTYPGMLDQAVAGGVARGESPLECIVREAGEESGLSAEMVGGNVVAAGTVTWFNISDEKAGGEPGLMNPGIIYVYDLEIGEDVVLEPVEDDIDSFSLMGVDEVKECLRRGDFKPSCAMVMLDFFIRHGLITAENEKDYETIASRLHRKLPFRTSPNL
ncbi:thiamine pyrophosphokinase [Diaporthe helianthi]|uniref:Thiamine pyrophosphokinase n=1 Tax=Diaporthe helianthi TaxID=158607 RepID=A0A2P5HGV8_DIAHE|nr:thiamine pyrophosphokinase [Diaporthe helianthi]